MLPRYEVPEFCSNGTHDDPVAAGMSHVGNHNDTENLIPYLKPGAAGVDYVAGRHPNTQSSYKNP